MIVYICEYTKRVCYKLLIYIYREVGNIIILHTNIYFYIFNNNGNFNSSICKRSACYRDGTVLVYVRHAWHAKRCIFFQSIC